MNTKKYLDKNGLIYLWGKIKEKLSTKVQSISIDSKTINKDENGNVNLPAYPTVPTDVSAFNNDKEYQTKENVSSAIADALSGITQVEFIKLKDGEYNAETGVPTISDAKSGKIYLTQNSGSTPNQYDEYIWLASDSAFEKIGTTDVDLSGYVLSSDLVAITNEDIETIINPPEVSA